MSASTTGFDELISREYQHGFVTDLEADALPSGLTEDVIRLISAKKNEPAFMLEWRLAAYRHWLTMTEPHWATIQHPPIDYQSIVYYSAPMAQKNRPNSLDEVDPELLRTYEKLGVPLRERELLAGVAVDAVFDSVSVATTFREKLAQLGIVFCSFSDAVQHHPELVRKYLGSVVPHTDNFFAALNSAVFSDGSFCYIPPGVRCPMELSTYFRINAQNTGQFERTLIIADKGAYVSYLEGCTAPMRDENQLHAAVVELIALEGAQIRYSTVQNWYPGDASGKGGIYNFVTKRGDCREANSKISWTQVETGSAITWKYPSVILQGDNAVGEFYSVALTNHYQQADTGTKMVHLGCNTRSTILSKGISAGRGKNAYRGLVKVGRAAEGARNYTQCDSLLLGDRCSAHTFPYIEVKNPTAKVEHEASTSRIGEDQLFYCRQRGLSTEDAVSMIVNGFCKEAGEVHAIMGPNGSGKSTLAHALAGREDCVVTGGAVVYLGRDLLALAPEERAHEGLFLAFQYPVEIPGVSNVYLLKAALNAQRRHRGEPELDAMEFLQLVKDRMTLMRMDESLLYRAVNEGFSGGEKKRNEILQMAVLQPRLAILDETDSGLDIDALQIVAQGVNSMRSPDRAIVLVTHYQRLLDYVVPDRVHVLANGWIVKSGSRELAQELERQGYGWIEDGPMQSVSAAGAEHP